jgi:hypothetical protein
MINILLISAGIGTYYIRNKPELKEQFFAFLSKLKQKAKDEWAKIKTKPEDKQ